MKPKARIDFELNGIFYEKDDEIDVKSKEALVKLNEMGFIEPLTPKEIQNFFGKEKESLKKKLLD